MVSFKGLNLGGQKQGISSILTPNLLSSTMGPNGGDVLNLASGLGIGGTSGADISGLLGSTSTGGLGSILGGGGAGGLGALLGGGSGGANPFSNILGNLGGMMNMNSGDGAIASSGVWQPNVLSNIDQPAYHLKFFMVSDSTTQQIEASGNVSLLSQGLVIAETGATVMNITEFEMTNMPSPQSVSRNFVATNMTLKLIEPLGASFLDKLYAGARQLGVANYQKAFYYIQIRFHGYDPASGQYVDQLGGKTWTFRTKLTDLTVDINEGGARYTITMVGADTFPAFSHYGMVNLSFAPSASTVGEFFTKLKETLEQSQIPLYGYVRHIYNFVIHPPPTDLDVMPINTPPETWALQNPDFSQQHSRQTSTSGTLGETEVGVGTEVSMKDIVNQVFSNTREGQILISRSETPEFPSNKADNAAVWKVVPEFNLAQRALYWDPVHDDYNYDITFHIIPHASTDILMSVEQREDSINQSTVMRKIQRLQEQGRLVKQYQYLFTGLNTEVIDFDIQGNLFWFGWVPNSMRSEGDSSQSTPEMMGDQQMDNQQTPSVKAQTDPLLQQLNQLVNQGISGINAGNALKIGELSGRIQSIFQQALNSQLGSVTGRGDNEYLETIDVGGSGGYPMPIPYEKPINADDRTSMGEVEHDTTSGQAVYAMAINQVFGVNGPLQDIELTIRGDPYWLGYSMLEQKPGQPGDGSGPEYHRGDNTLMLQFVFPDGIGENGEPILKPVNLFTGIYNVHTLTNKFSGGKFTQVLKGIRVNALGLEASSFGGLGLGDLGGGFTNTTPGAAMPPETPSTTAGTPFSGANGLGSLLTDPFSTGDSGLALPGLGGIAGTGQGRGFVR